MASAQCYDVNLVIKLLVTYGLIPMFGKLFRMMDQENPPWKTRVKRNIFYDISLKKRQMQMESFKLFSSLCPLLNQQKAWKKSKSSFKASFYKDNWNN